jgi:hypothetical protein
LLARRKFARVEREFGAQLVDVAVGQVDRRTPVDLPVIIPERQAIRIVRGDFAHARAYGEDHLHQLVERWFK